MNKNRSDWKPDLSLPTGKGATRQRFDAEDKVEHLSIETEAWGEGDLKANGVEIAHVDDGKSASDAFRNLDRIAGECEEARDAFANEPASDTARNGENGNS